MRVEGIRYQEGAIVLHLLEYGPDDAPCCPTLPVQRRFQLEGGALREVAAGASNTE